MLHTYALALLGVIAAQISPGPNLVAVAGAALDQGRRAGLGVALGVASGVLVWAVAVAYGLGALLVTHPGVLTGLRLVGGAVLLALGGRAIRAAWRGGRAVAPGRKHSAARSWRRGLVVVLTNPKAAMMWAAVASFLFGGGLTTAQVALFGPLAATSAAVIYGSYALLFSTRRALAAYQRFARAFEGTFGVIFAAFGISLIWGVVQALI